MEMKIIGTALSLIAIYLVLALIASQIRELLSGVSTTGRIPKRFRVGLIDSRRQFLEQMVQEAFGADSSNDDHGELIKQFFKYGPIYALSKGESRPSAIPPDLFASSFLAVLNKNSPPRKTYRFPSDFVSDLKFDGHLHEVLNLKLAGAETDWNEFEGRIAKWYSDIGDRAGGWYRKNNSRWLLIISLALAAAINADTFYLAKTLYGDDQLRIAVANIAELAATEAAQSATLNSGGTPAMPPSPLPPSSEFVRASQAATEFDTALVNIRVAFQSDTQIAGFGYDYNDLRNNCITNKKPKKEWYASNSDAWLVLMPAIQQLLDEARFGVQQSQEKPTELQLTQAMRTEKLRQVLACASAVAVWVKAAQGDAETDATKANLKTAGEALDRARMIVMDQLTLFSGQTRLVQMYRSNAKGFQDCADAAGGSRAEFDSCMKDANTNNIPLGWPSEKEQFCDVKQLPRNAKPEEETWLLKCDDFNPESVQALGLPAIESTFSGFKLLSFLIGIALTAILVSLGAPFWFDILGKVVNLRIAGRARGLSETTAPPPSPAPSGTSASGGAPGPNDSGPVPAAKAPFDDARNEFERTLRPKEISRLQKALDVSPTGRLDQVTRNAIAAKLKDMDQPPEDELTSRSYEAIVGRAAPVAVEIKQGTWQRNQTVPKQEFDEFISALNKLFPEGKDWKKLEPKSSSYDDNIRARVVLYRYYTDTEMDAAKKSVVLLSKTPNGELTKLNKELRDEIIARANKNKTLKFEPVLPLWLNFALGELGITEDCSPTKSDTRVVDYLLTLGANKNDETAWCGAFVGWSIAQADKLDNNLKHGIKKDALIGADNWKDFGDDKMTDKITDRLCGDICVVNNKKDNQSHVGFWIKEDEKLVWLLGGNQGPSGSITLTSFNKDVYQIDAIQRPA